MYFGDYGYAKCELSREFLLVSLINWRQRLFLFIQGRKKVSGCDFSLEAERSLSPCPLATRKRLSSYSLPLSTLPHWGRNPGLLAAFFSKLFFSFLLSSFRPAFQRGLQLLVLLRMRRFLTPSGRETHSFHCTDEELRGSLELGWPPGAPLQNWFPGKFHWTQTCAGQEALPEPWWGRPDWSLWTESLFKDICSLLFRLFPGFLLAVFSHILFSYRNRNPSSSSRLPTRVLWPLQSYVHLLSREASHLGNKEIAVTLIQSLHCYLWVNTLELDFPLPFCL